MSEKPIQKVERIEKPWGFELVWAKTDTYVGKILSVTAGHALSLQYHRSKVETLFLEAGECIIESGNSEAELEKTLLRPGDTFHVPAGRLHRIIAVTDTRLFEVSTPHLSDVVRIRDDYGRA